MTDIIDDDDPPFDPDARVAEIEADMQEAQDDQPFSRRIEDYVYVCSDDKYRNVVHMSGPLGDRAVDASIDRAFWQVLPPAPGAPANAPPQLQRPSVTVRSRLDLVCDRIVWWPGRERIVRGAYLAKGGPVYGVDLQCLNTYTPAPDIDGDAEDVGPWLHLFETLVPNPKEHEALMLYFAAMVQAPERKVNSGVILAGPPGIGKDSLLAPLKLIVGNQNHDTIDPHEVFDKNNPWVQNVMLIVNEMEPGDEHSAWDMIKRLKRVTAAPPETLSVMDKYEKRTTVMNVIRVFAFSNDLKSIRMEKDQRRWLIVNSTHLASRWHLATDPAYFKKYNDWWQAGGWKNIAAYLKNIDLSSFDFGNPFSFKTDAAIELERLSNAAPQDAFEHALERCDHRPVIFSNEMRAICESDPEYRRELDRIFRNAPFVAQRAERSGYELVLPKPGPQFQFRPDGSANLPKYKPAYAFVKSEIAKAEREEAIQARGKQIANERVAGASSVSAGGVPASGNVHPLRGSKL